jgi:cob(I)alamin adenosyltransferase
VARTTVRRAERLVARLTHEGLLRNGQVLRFLNRLSALLFAMACLEDHLATGRRPTAARAPEDRDCGSQNEA